MSAILGGAERLLSVGAQQVRDAFGIYARVCLLQRPLFFSGGLLQGGHTGSPFRFAKCHHSPLPRPSIVSVMNIVQVQFKVDGCMQNFNVWNKSQESLHTILHCAAIIPVREWKNVNGWISLILSPNPIYSPMFIGVQRFYFKLQAHRVLESSKPPKTLRSRLSTEKPHFQVMARFYALKNFMCEYSGSFVNDIGNFSLNIFKLHRE